ncbi:hypothetical protein ACRALDRAFT_209588 [Sodiomyces alcalophilus JCM 7366]|uniref:uncharacterized protein n=1 Tax=Sodiomyces alcalophilus JCM 7366 TaxID=591952 RepID=UPI0039B4BD51
MLAPIFTPIGAKTDDEIVCIALPGREEMIHEWIILHYLITRPSILHFTLQVQWSPFTLPCTLSPVPASPFLYYQTPALRVIHLPLRAMSHATIPHNEANPLPISAGRGFASYLPSTAQIRTPRFVSHTSMIEQLGGLTARFSLATFESDPKRSGLWQQQDWVYTAASLRMDPHLALDIE